MSNSTRMEFEFTVTIDVPDPSGITTGQLLDSLLRGVREKLLVLDEEIPGHLVVEPTKMTVTRTGGQNV